MDSFNLDDFDNPPPPPKFLYKYLSAGRVENVLEGGMVRFTPLLDTNDTFEVRSTFSKLAGPKMLAMLSEQMDKTLSEEFVLKMTTDMLKERAVDFPPHLLLQLADQKLGGSLMPMLRQGQHAPRCKVQTAKPGGVQSRLDTGRLCGQAHNGDLREVPLNDPPQNKQGAVKIASRYFL